VKRERHQPTRVEWAAITSSRPVVRRVLERRPHSSRPENPHSPGPIARGTRPGQSSRSADKAHALVRWYAECSRGNLPWKGAA
jgi:hypothetical protein